MKHVSWTTAEGPAGAAPGRDEFGPEVSAAIADLRARGGLASPVDPAHADVRRDDLHFAVAGVNRRGFLQLTGAAAVYAVVAGCSDPHPDTLVPFAQQPEGAAIGQPRWYSTLVRVNGRARPVMARSYDGRPIKLEGNPDHPQAKGRSDAQTQAALLDLYDPDRGVVDPEHPGAFHDGPRRREDDGWKPTTWPALDKAVGAGLKSGRILLLTGPVDGPGRLALIRELTTAFAGRLVHAAYHPFAEDAAVLARVAVLGAASTPAYRLDRARVLVALGSDILGGGTQGIAEQVQFGDFRRGAEGEPGQVICFEPTMSQLGTVADVRVRCGMDRVAWIGWAIGKQVASALGLSLPPAVAAALDGVLPQLERELRPVGEVPAIRFAAERLLAARQAGKPSLVYAGGAVHTASPELHAAATWLNQALGNEGVTVLPATPAAGATVALDGWNAIIVAGCNPAFDLPGAAAALAKVPLLVSLNPTRDETTELAHWHAPGLHDLETWGDASSFPGLAELQQPLVNPLWDSRAAEDSLIAVTVAALGAAAPSGLRAERSAVPAGGGAVSVVSRKQLWGAGEHSLRAWRDYLKAVWIGVVAPASGAAASGEAFWTAALARGFVELPPATPAAAGAGPIPLPAAPASTGLSLVCTAARTVGDGGQLNNAWLQELPDPVSKVTWDGYAALSPVDAAAAGIASHDVIELKLASGAVRLPALIQDGQHPGTVEVFLGWGRSSAGLVAAITAEDGHRANAYGFGRRWGIPVALAKTGGRYQLAIPQGHAAQEGRKVALDDVLELHRADPGARRREARHELWTAGTDGKAGGRLSVWRTHHEHPGHLWGMAVDLDACTGCGACIVACSAENNVPVVGRDETRRMRNLHWMRIDRYWSAPEGEAAARLDVAALHQPMLCQQCDNAPCEAVCPANATMKSAEGVNLQVYNRCIGTRYCSNNCPYRVRRFNWYQYSAFRAGPRTAGDPALRLARNVMTEGAIDTPAESAHQPLQLALNPEVTVRHRGVMEKCNFCLQRQRDWRDREKAELRALPDGVITTACAQACPTRAITWGDLNDAGSAVAKAGGDDRAFLCLDEELNTRPKIAYLRKLRHRPATAAERSELATEKHG